MPEDQRETRDMTLEKIKDAQKLMLQAEENLRVFAAREKSMMHRRHDSALADSAALIIGDLEYLIVHFGTRSEVKEEE